MRELAALQKVNYALKVDVDQLKRSQLRVQMQQQQQQRQQQMQAQVQAQSQVHGHGRNMNMSMSMAKDMSGCGWLSQMSQMSQLQLSAAPMACHNRLGNVAYPNLHQF
jgi:transcription initiation factor TFIID subunit TAF12